MKKVKGKKKKVTKPKKKKIKEVKKQKLLDYDQILSELYEIATFTNHLQIKRALNVLKETSEYSVTDLQKQLKTIQDQNKKKEQEQEAEDIKKYLSENKYVRVVVDLQDYLMCKKKNQERILDYWLAQYNKTPFENEKHTQEISPGLIVTFVNQEKQREEKDSIKQAVNNIANYNIHAAEFIRVQPFFYDKAKIWWLWNKKRKKWEIIDDVDLMNRFDEEFEIYSISQKTKTEIIEALKRLGRKNIPKNIKTTWIQFEDKIIDIKTGEEFEATPEFFVTNPIPWRLNKERYIETPNMNRIFKEWVGEDHVQTLYEILAYSLLPDYPIHRLFCFIGPGLNGKSCFLRLLEKFLEEDNITATELDTLISSRFEVTRLHKKLVCIMGETNFSEMSKTSVIKKLTGQDVIGFEYKNKTPFEGRNYAKIMIATNNLPTTTDKTLGFYRRWLIIDFPNQFSEKKDILQEIPDEEYEQLAVKCLGILKNLLEKREFHNEGSIEERMKKYEDKSDPLEKFIKEFTSDDADHHIFKWEFEKRLNEWCKENRFRQIAENTIGKKMKEKGFETGQITVPSWDNEISTTKKIRAWIGIKWENEGNNGEQAEQV